MKMVSKIRVGRYSPEETPFDETRIDLLIPGRSETMSKRICLIKRDDRSHHVDNGLCAEPGNGGAPVVLELICDAAEEGSQALTLAREMLGPRSVRRCKANTAKCPPRLFGVAHSD